MVEITPIVNAINSSKLEALESLFDAQLAQDVRQAMGQINATVSKINYTINQTITEGNHLAFTYTATATGKSGKSGSWTGSGVATLADSKIVQLRVHEDAVAKAIAIGEAGSLAAIAGPSVTGTWTGAAHGITVTLNLKQSGTKISGTASVSGFPGTSQVSGENNAPHDPNIVLNTTLGGLNAEYEGDFENDNTISGTLMVAAFPHIQVTVTRKA
jgi:hypothetical protein